MSATELNPPDRNDAVQAGDRFVDLFSGNVPIPQVLLEFGDMQGNRCVLVLCEQFVVRLLQTLPDESGLVFEPSSQAFGFGFVGKALGRAPAWSVYPMYQGARRVPRSWERL